MNETEKFEMIEAMEKYGGGFVKALAICFMKADLYNFEKLCAAFPEYVEKYKTLGKEKP